MTVIPGLLQIRTPLVNFHVLRDQTGLYLLDTGFVGGLEALRRTLRQAGWSKEPVRGIILTHGHLDHIFNVASIVKETGAWVAAPAQDHRHYAGKPLYHGRGKLTGAMEAIGRRWPGFEPFAPDRFLADGAELDVWDGLRAVHLPGHTDGHTGYFCAEHRVLFCADLFASFRFGTRLPPSVFNARPELIADSVCKALALGPDGVIPNHADRAEPAVHLLRLERLALRLGR